MFYRIFIPLPSLVFSMVKLLRTVCSSLLLFCVVFFLGQGCSKREGCTDPKAENFDPSAERENNTCILARQKFLGIYTASDLCFPNPAISYFAEIIASNENLTDIRINLFHDGYYVRSVIATVNKNEIVIPRQDPDGNGRYIDGDGSIVGNTLTIQFAIRIGGGPEKTPDISCISTLQK